MTVASNFINAKDGIEDNDQKEVMSEVLKYLQCDETGSYVFGDVKKEWKEFVTKSDNCATLSEKDECVIGSAKDLAQLESHLALELSKISYSFVNVVENKQLKENYKDKIDFIAKDLRLGKIFESKLRIKNSISDLEIKLFFAAKKIELSVVIEIPEDKDKNKSKLNWLKSFHLDYCSKKNQADFSKISNELFIELYIKNTSKFERYSFVEFDQILIKFGEKEIKEFKLVFVKNNLGKMFDSSKIIGEVENSCKLFYKVFIENLRQIKQEVPKIQGEAIAVMAESVVAVNEPEDSSLNDGKIAS